MSMMSVTFPSLKPDPLPASCLLRNRGKGRYARLDIYRWLERISCKKLCMYVCACMKLFGFWGLSGEWNVCPALILLGTSLHNQLQLPWMTTPSALMRHFLENLLPSIKTSFSIHSYCCATFRCSPPTPSWFWYILVAFHFFIPGLTLYTYSSCSDSTYECPQQLPEWLLYLWTLSNSLTIICTEFLFPDWPSLPVFACYTEFWHNYTTVILVLTNKIWFIGIKGV